MLKLIILLNQDFRGHAVSSAGRKVTKKQLTDSFIDPFK
jgi:hypothetical protein